MSGERRTKKSQAAINYAGKRERRKESNGEGRRREREKKKRGDKRRDLILF